ncbi:hypothetical protein [Mesobacterium pallidum]|uniref:hypothetical protein n=1 Tax=Mesobacterium pallidum TaxID=2872037 RepID=UPI001EE38164|nr:hypothetical protein [Mesobacterium pallidum]
MNTIIKSTISIGALGLLSACAEPIPPTFDETDVIASKVRYLALDGLPETATADMPTTGTADYKGRLSADIDGDTDGSVLADLDLSATFDTGAISGRVHNINAFDSDGTPDQKLDGSIRLNGSVFGNDMSATGTGTLTGVDSGFEGDTRATVNLNGTFRSNTAAADTITGDVSGFGRGDIDFTITDGEFYAE